MNLQNLSHGWSARMPLLLLACNVVSWAQPASPGRLDFLKAQDASFALVANTSATFQPGKKYPNEMLLITGLPFAPVISARVDFGLGDPHCAEDGRPETPVCGRLRNMALSPDGDTALVATDPSDAQPAAGRDEPVLIRDESVLILVRNVRAFVQSKKRSDLRIRLFKASDNSHLDNVAGIAFGPGGKWAVVSTRGEGPLDLTYTKPTGTIVLITGLPDNPQFSKPYPVPMHSVGNISLSLDGNTLLLNDTTDRSIGVLSSNQIIMQGVQPGGGQPRVVATSHLALPDIPGVTELLQPVRDAKLTMDGRFVIAPVSVILSSGDRLVPYNRIEILGPVRPGKLPARTLTAAEGVNGGPVYTGISPDGDSALVVHNIDDGGADLLTGLATGDPFRFTLKPLPFPSFGPPFPLGPTGPPVLAPHSAVAFTPDGKTALVQNWVIPPLAESPLVPSISVLTGFDTGKIQVAATLTHPVLNVFDISQQTATVPSGLLDYVNLYVAPGATRDGLTSLVNQAIAASGDRNPAPAIALLARFIVSTIDLRLRSVLNGAQATTLITLAIAGAQAVTGPVTNLSSAGLMHGPVAPESIASLHGEALAGSRMQVDIFDSTGIHRSARLIGSSSGRIDYLVPRETAAGKAVGIISNGGAPIAAVAMDIDPAAGFGR